MVKGLCEAVPSVELRCWLVDGVHDHQSSRDRFACEDCFSQGVCEQPRAKADTLLGLVDGKAGDQHQADGIRGHAPDELGGCVGALRRTHCQADIGQDAQAARHDEGTRRVHLLRGERVATEPAVELLDAAFKGRKVVIRAQALETQIARAQLRGSGSLRNSATSSGTIVAGSSRAA